MRYSKVEFVAILSTLLKQHHVEPRRQAGDGKEAARQRTLGVLGDCKFSMTLYMADARSVAMCWTLRSAENRI